MPLDVGAKILAAGPPRGKAAPSRQMGLRYAPRIEVSFLRVGATGLTASTASICGLCVIANLASIWASSFSNFGLILWIYLTNFVAGSSDTSVHPYQGVYTGLFLGHVLHDTDPV
jgi:hypothetical protein